MFLIGNPLPPLTGAKEQVEQAERIRNKTLHWMWRQEFYGKFEDFHKYCDRLPREAVWWLEHHEDTCEAVCAFLGIEFRTRADADC